MNQAVCSQIRHPAFLILSYFIEGEKREIIDSEKHLCPWQEEKGLGVPQKIPNHMALNKSLGLSYSLTKSNAASCKNIVKGRLLDTGNEL